nr:type II toxin-antitoxin system RelE/ParE family toxin [Bradyrhizobium sp. UNPA324]
MIAGAVGQKFIDVIGRIRRAPFSAPRVAHRSQVRVATVVRYPFGIFRRVNGDVIHIVHVRHTSRRPLGGLNEPGKQYA